MRDGMIVGLALVGFAVTSSRAAQASTLTLAEAGQAKAVIVVEPDAPKPVQHAADELASFLQQVTRASFDRTDKPDPSRTNIAVGPGAAKMVDPSFTTEGLGREGIVLRAVDPQNLILAGGEPRGTLYAVYTFLEDHIGCRWWTSRASAVPKQPTLSIPTTLNVRYVPPLEYRYPFWTDAFDADWLGRNKANGHWVRRGDALDEQELIQRYGGYASHGGVHTFYRLIPPDDYFADHPEWFSEIDGRRKWKHAQLCLSNEAMRAELIKNLKQRIRKRPQPPIYSVSQNDWHGYCTCAKCNALAEKYGGQSGLMVWFVNQAAQAVEDEFPDYTISTLAYQYTRRPPVNIRPRPNVAIQLCSIECSFAVPLTHPRNAAFRDDIVGWSQAADRLYIWDYTTDFRHYFIPHPNLRVLGPNVRFFVEHHAKGIFEQGAYTSRGAEFAELRAWVLAKLLWDPTRDDQALIREFCEGYYGSAAPHVLAYIDLIHDAATAHNEYAHCLPSYDHQFEFLNFEVLSAAWRHMQAAQRAAANDPQRRPRVEAAQLWVLYAFLWRWNDLKTQAAAAGADWPIDPDIRRVAAHFKKVAVEHGVTRVNEWHDGFGLVDQCVERAVR